MTSQGRRSHRASFCRTHSHRRALRRRRLAGRSSDRSGCRGRSGRARRRSVPTAAVPASGKARKEWVTGSATASAAGSVSAQASGRSERDRRAQDRRGAEAPAAAAARSTSSSSDHSSRHWLGSAGSVARQRSRSEPAPRPRSPLREGGATSSPGPPQVLERSARNERARSIVVGKGLQDVTRRYVSGDGIEGRRRGLAGEPVAGAEIA